MGTLATAPEVKRQMELHSPDDGQLAYNMRQEAKHQLKSGQLLSRGKKNKGGAPTWLKETLRDMNFIYGDNVSFAKAATAVNKLEDGEQVAAELL
jgi:hypothetical protein